MARCAITNDTGVIEGATGECAGCVADIAIFNCRHMVACLAGCIGSVVAGITTDRGHQFTAVVNEGVSKAHRVMAYTAVLSGGCVIGRHADCRGSVMAGGTGLGHRIENRVVETTVHLECLDAMADRAIHVRQGMILCLPSRVSAIVTGDTAIRYIAVVDIRRKEGVRCVTVATLTISDDVPCIHACGCGSIVTSGAGAGIGTMVEAATGQAIQEVFGIVALIALLGSRYMKFRFSYGQNTVVALATDPKDFLMID
jgi:hypothetical protein